MGKTVSKNTNVNNCYLLERRVASNDVYSLWLAKAIFSPNMFNLQFMERGVHSFNQSEVHSLQLKLRESLKRGSIHLMIPIEFGPFEDRLYFASQVIEGMSLSEVSAKNPKLSFSDNLMLLSQLVEALHELESVGLSHGMLNPESILIPSSGLSNSGLKLSLIGPGLLHEQNWRDDLPESIARYLPEPGLTPVQRDIYSLAVIIQSFCEETDEDYPLKHQKLLRYLEDLKKNCRQFNHFSEVSFDFYRLYSAQESHSIYHEHADALAERGNTSFINLSTEIKEEVEDLEDLSENVIVYQKNMPRYAQGLEKSEWLDHSGEPEYHQVKKPADETDNAQAVSRPPSDDTKSADRREEPDITHRKRGRASQLVRRTIDFFKRLFQIGHRSRSDQTSPADASIEKTHNTIPAGKQTDESITLVDNHEENQDTSASTEISSDETKSILDEPEERDDEYRTDQIDVEEHFQSYDRSATDFIFHTSDSDGIHDSSDSQRALAEREADRKTQITSNTSRSTALNQDENSIANRKGNFDDSLAGSTEEPVDREKLDLTKRNRNESVENQESPSEQDLISDSTIPEKYDTSARSDDSLTIQSDTAETLPQSEPARKQTGNLSSDNAIKRHDDSSSESSKQRLRRSFFQRLLDFFKRFYS